MPPVPSGEQERQEAHDEAIDAALALIDGATTEAEQRFAVHSFTCAASTLHWARRRHFARR